MSLKVETVSVCYGCLSADRNAVPLCELSEIFYILIPQTFTDDVLLCWECRGILMKTWRFQQRIQQAQILMQTPEFLHDYSISSLSTLQIKVIDSNYDIVYENYSGNDDKVKLEIEPEFNKIHSHVDDKLHFEEIKIKCKEVIDIENNDLKNKQFDEYFDVEIYEKINSDEKIHIETKEIENKSKLIEKKRKIPIGITPKIEKSYLDEMYQEDLEDSYNESIEIVEKPKRLRKKQVQYTSEERPSRFKKLELITKSTLNMERFYETSVVSEKVLEDLLDKRISTKYYGKFKFNCGICNIPFYKKINLRRHNILKHLPEKGPYKCCECVYETQNISELHEHWRKHKVYKCCLCPNSSVTETQILRHLQQTHRYIYQCLECRKEFYEYRDIFLHYKEAHNQRICDHCGKAFRRKKLLEQHMIYQHLPRKCEYCGEICRSSHGLGVHKRICRPEKHFKTIVPELSYCVECDKQYDSIEKYQNHLRSAVIHNPPVPLQPVKVPCPECGKTFSRKLYMNNHYKLFHMKTSKHYCDICNKYFISAFSLRTHRKGVHEKKHPPKNKICDVCGRGFGANRILIHHKRTHTGEKPYQCAYCPSAFAQITARKTHERTQHNVM